MEPWPSVGFEQLGRNDRAELVPSDAWWRRQLARPELALVPESCAAEQALHATLQASPTQPVDDATLARLADDDARGNWRVFLAFRDRVLAAGSVEAAYVGLFDHGPVDIAPVFVDLLAQAILRGLLDRSDDALEWRAAEMLFRPQRCSTVDGRLVAGDRDTLDRLNRQDSAGAVGLLLREAGAAPRAAQLEVLSPDTAAGYFPQAERHRLLLDLTAELEHDIGHGVNLRLANARSGQKGLARVLERWVAHLLGVSVRITPKPRIDEANWRWHVGLDVQATALLNDLYTGQPVDDDRLRSIVALFRLDFVDASSARADLAGTPVYLAAAMGADGLLRLKPQNLLTNLPLAARN